MSDLFRVQSNEKRSLRLNKNRKLWVDDDMFSPDIADEQAQSYAKSDGYLGHVIERKRFIGLVVTVLFFFVFLLTRAGQLQIVKGAYYENQSLQNRRRYQTIRSDRGLIYDRYQTPLVQNIPNHSVILRPQLLPAEIEERKELLKPIYQDYLAEYRNDTWEDFYKYIESLRLDPNQFDKDIIITSQVKKDHAIALQLLFKEIPAFDMQIYALRDYLNEGPVNTTPDDTTIYPPVKSVSHILGYLTFLRDGEYKELADKGYVFNDVIGRSGLEAEYEEILRGTYGRQEVEVDALGRPKQVLAKEDAIDGYNLQTSLDIEFQRAIESILQKHLDENEKFKGSVVILDPNTGEVLALVSLPTFDNNHFSRGISSEEYSRLAEDENHPLFNRSISGEYPSGSTFKPIVAAAALEDQIVNQHTNIISTGGIRIDRWFFPDWRAGGHGYTNVYHALADSVNTYFYLIGGGDQNNFEGLGVQRITDYARTFGLNDKLGVDLPGERPGFLPSKEWKEEVKKERWYIGDTYHLAIGQGDLLVTPLQVATYTAAFANGGNIYKPHIATGLLDKNLQLVESFDPEIVVPTAVSKQNIEIIQDGLRRVVTQGSGKRLYDLPIQVAGKTGTAQWNTNKDPHAWFTGYAPFDNPKIAFTVLVEEGKEGSSITVSITKDILNWWYYNRVVENQS